MGIQPKFTRVGRLFAKQHHDGRLKVAVCLPDVDDLADSKNVKRPKLAARYQELFETMKKKGLVPLSDLLNAKSDQAGRIVDADEVYRLAQAIGMESQRHGDAPLSPEKVWVPLSDVTEPLQATGKRPRTAVPVDDNKVLWFTPDQLAAYYQNKEAQTVRLWARDGSFEKDGYRVKKDRTGHWLIGIPDDHKDYPEFLAFSQSIKR
jgi:hypothetical protein